MFGRLTALAVLSIALLQGATFAQPLLETTQPQNVPQQIREKLTAQGFTEVNVVPSSYLISAKNKRGDAVAMVIGPDSMTMISGNPDTSAPDDSLKQ